VFLYFSEFILIIFLLSLCFCLIGTLLAFFSILATRSGHHSLFAFDPEIERTLHTRRRANQASTSSPPVVDPISLRNLFDFDSEVAFDNMAEQRTLRQLAAPDVNYNGLCIEYADIVVPFELKSGLIHLLPRFSGLAGEDPHNH
jgi:hypothetical protein